MQESSEAVSWFAGLGIFALIIGVITTLFWIWMLIDCVMSTRLNGTEKIVWALVILFLHFLGALIYFLVKRGAAAKPLERS